MGTPIATGVPRSTRRPFLAHNDSTLVRDAEAHDGETGEAFVMEVSPELSPHTIQQRWQAVNVILRLSMLAGLQMQLDATLRHLANFASEITPHERSLTFFWDENEQQVRLRTAEGVQELPPTAVAMLPKMNWVPSVTSRE